MLHRPVAKAKKTKKGTRTPTRERLIDAAAREFALKGYEGASLEGIASAVGIKAPSIFKHFAGKQALYDAILGDIQATFVMPAEQFMSRRSDPVEALLLVWEYYWDFCEAHPHYAALLFREAFHAGNPRLQGLSVATDFSVSLARTYVRHAQEEGQVRKFDPDSHIFWAIGYPMMFFAVPGLRANLWQGRRSKTSVREAKTSFLKAAEYFLRPRDAE